jgi:uncharacterized protein
MSCLDEQDLVGVVIDSLKFAADGGCITGKLDLSSLPRLADVLAGTVGCLVCELSGFRDTDNHDGKFGLHLRVTGRLDLWCQRCLAEVEFECVIDNHLLLMPPGAPESEWPEDELESDDYDAIPASRELSVQSLVEDEVLLALPIVPRHADCLPPEVLETKVRLSEPSPFAVLAGLKKH